MIKKFRISDYLEHIESAIGNISNYLAGNDEAAFLSNRMLQDAIVRNLEIIGEAARNITRADPEFLMKYPQLPIKRAIGMRNS